MLRQVKKLQGQFRVLYMEESGAIIPTAYVENNLGSLFVIVESYT